MRVAVAMSGGVDSSVAAALLKARGLDVVGLTMKLWVGSAATPEAKAGEDAIAAPARGDVCCPPQNVLDAKAVCGGLGIPHYVLDMAEDFSRQVIDPFVEDYTRGRTPNPCAWCNERIKSKGLLRRAKELGCEALATGHYARIDTDPASGRRRLKVGREEDRDQSYFLFPVTQDALRFLRFPVGELSKGEVRRIAGELGLKVAEKPDSQEICFVQDNDHRRFLRERAPEAFEPGPILHEDGRELGTHAGMAGYTIGQRRGLGVAWTEPLYVIDLDLERNAVVLGPDRSLWKDALEARAMHWISGTPPAGPLRVRARIRHGGDAAACTVIPGPDRRAAVRFDEPLRAIAPGQAVVLYDGEVVLGGGWIERALSLGPGPAPAVG